MDTLTKLLPIKMVANKRCGLSTSFTILRSALLSLSRIVSIKAGSNEKKATSDAEITAETTISKKLIINSITAEIVIGCTIMPEKMVNIKFGSKLLKLKLIKIKRFVLLSNPTKLMIFFESKQLNLAKPLDLNNFKFQ